MGRRQRIVQLDSFARSFVGQKLALPGSEPNAVAGSDVISIGEAGIGEGIVRIGGDGLLK